jgi:hypothetical protein
MPMTTARSREAATAAMARSPASRPDICADPCPPRCPNCGGLECLCRPRFFPGQLLTDETLNLLSRYVVEKNKLHNRYLHGWGVACGLEVTCDPCNPKQVVVRTGYALAPCGDDIVVCNDQAVNICELIDQCRPQTQTVCDPPYERPPKDCRAGNNRWVLAICYDERPSRGLTALLGAADSACKSPCRCGGSAGCPSCGGSGCNGGASCSYGGSGAGPGRCTPAKAYSSKPRSTRQQNCEPTQVCEGYRFIAYPAPSTTSPTPLPDFGHAEGTSSSMSPLLGWMFTNRAHLGPLLERMLCCVGRAQELLSEWGKGQKVGGLDAYDAYQQYAESMYAFASEFTLHRCAFVGRVGRLYDSAIKFGRTVGDVQQLNPLQVDYVKDQLAQFDDALLEIVSECFCAALLPPCPEPAEGNCVPLAVVTLQANDCRVADICNWEARKLLVSWRTVSYWLSWIPWHCVRDIIAKFCCGPRRGGPVMQVLSLILGVSVVGSFCGKVVRKPEIGAVAAPPIGNLAQAAKSDDLLMHLLEEFDRGRSGEAAAPPWFKLAARLADGSLFDDIAAIGGKGGVPEMQAQIQALARTVDSQQAQINKLLRGQHG